MCRLQQLVKIHFKLFINSGINQFQVGGGRDEREMFIKKIFLEIIDL